MKKQEPLSVFSPQIKNIMFYIMLIIIVFLCVYIYIKVKDGSVECMANPISYGIKNMKANDNAPISCICSSLTSMDSVLYTKDNVSIIQGKGGAITWEK